MVTEAILLSKDFQFKHISVNILEKDDNNNVLVFVATTVTATSDEQSVSAGLIEINRTLWNSDSPKRPQGYWLLGSPENNGIMKSYFVSDEWLSTTPKDIQVLKCIEWGL